MGVNRAEINHVIRSLGLEDKPACLHSSLRSFGPVEGGPLTLVNAFLEAGCTLLVPTFSHKAFAIAPPDHLKLDRNGYDYSYQTSRLKRTQAAYTPSSTEIDGDMGALPAVVLTLPEHTRGNHPLNSFSAVGPYAKTLTEGQDADCVYMPLMQLAELGGFVVLAGVGLTRMTLLHLAEQQSGRAPFRRWALAEDGEPEAVEVGGCSEGFGKLAPVLVPYVQRARVGTSEWQVFHAGDALRAVAKAVLDQPKLTHCDDMACERCNDAILGGPIRSMK